MIHRLVILIQKSPGVNYIEETTDYADYTDFFVFSLCPLYYSVAKPCFYSKIFPSAFAYACSNNRLGVPPPLCPLWLNYFQIR
jgi:hypothetical protein